jgi:hypothetical protein
MSEDEVGATFPPLDNELYYMFRETIKGFKEKRLFGSVFSQPSLEDAELLFRVIYLHKIGAPVSHEIAKKAEGANYRLTWSLVNSEDRANLDKRRTIP